MGDTLLLAVFAGGIVYLAMWALLRRRERVLAEKEASEARFRALTELSADWFWETDAEHRIVWLSGGGPVAMLFGSAPTYGKRFWDIAGIEVDARTLRAHQERLARELPFFDLEIGRTDERGARQVHIVSGQCRRGADGAFLGYRGVGRDVTLERRSEQAVAQAKERLELALDGGNLAEWHLDLESDTIYTGSGWSRFLGHDYGVAKFTGTKLLQRIHADDTGAARAQLVQVVKDRIAVYDAEFRISTRLGGWRWVHVRARVVERDASGRAKRMSGIVADVDARKRAQTALTEAEQRWRALVEVAPDGIIVSCNRVIEYANPAAARIARVSSPRELLGRKITEFVHPDHAARYDERSRFLEAAPGRTDFEERRLRLPDGALITAEVASVSFLERGRLLLQTVFRDVTESHKAREALAEREQRFRDVAEAAGEYVWETDTEERLTYLSERVEAVLGYSPAELLGRQATILMPLGEERAMREWLERHKVGRKAFRDLPMRQITKSGRAIWLSVSAVPRLDASGAFAGYRGTAADVTPRKQAEERIEYLSTRDALTSLANRGLLAERAGAAILEAARSRSRLALLCVDLDRFRLVNEALGHAAGDALLRAVAERLNNTLRREDTLARLGADRFVLLWNGLRTDVEAATLAQRVLAVLGRPFTVDGRTLAAGASIGMALYPDHGRDFAELLKNADGALSHAKETARGGWTLYQPQLGAAASARIRTENELRGALARSELVLHWQPVLEGTRIVGAEALVRWRHPERGLLLPDEFLALAETSGLMGTIGNWTLERACSQAGAWQRSLPGEAWFALNVTAPELATGAAFVRRIEDCLEANALDGARIELEVTERALLADVEHNIATLRRVAELGVRFAIDDFGTGYSSLAYLRQLPIHKLKIDRMFLRRIVEDPADRAVVGTIASLARTLGLTVAAEGVENRAQLDVLLELGCEHWQGHYFSEPVDAAAFEAMLRSERALRIKTV